MNLLDIAAAAAAGISAVLPTGTPDQAIKEVTQTIAEVRIIQNDNKSSNNKKDD